MIQDNTLLRIKKNVNKIESYLRCKLDKKVIDFNVKRIEAENIKLQAIK